MYELKPLPSDSIASSLEMAHRYRLLNQPALAESIYRDILAADAKSSPAIQGLIRALSDQFDGSRARVDEARTLIERLTEGYDRNYYNGLVLERWGRAEIQGAKVPDTALASLREAMRYYAEAEAQRPSDNADAVLRWNACARTLMNVSRPAAYETKPRLKGDLPLE
jgi:hypothetical protein